MILARHADREVQDGRDSRGAGDRGHSLVGLGGARYGMGWVALDTVATIEAALRADDLDLLPCSLES